MRSILSWIARNLGTLFISLMLAIVVWVSAVVTEDPNRQQTTRPIEVQVIGQDPDLLMVGNLSRQARVTLQAPQSIWDLLNNNANLIKIWVDLSGLTAGEHNVPVRVRVDASPVRTIGVEPAEMTINLEPLSRRTIPMELDVRGALPLGYQQGAPRIDPAEVTISGPESRVAEVARAYVGVNISGATTALQETVPVELLDSNGAPVEDVAVTPGDVTAHVPVSLLGGFKNVAVKVVSIGQVANGYRLTNISVSPPTITIFSDDLDLIEQIPGYVETLPVDLNNLTDDVEIVVDLNLPTGVSLVREPNVVVQVSVAAIEGTLTVSVPVEVVGLESGLDANVSPEVVDVIVSGPINQLEVLTPADFRVVLDLTGLPAGVYQRQVIVDRVPEGMHVQTTLPESVEVTIAIAPTPTNTPRGGGPPTPTPTPTPTNTPTPSATPRQPIRPTRTPPS